MKVRAEIDFDLIDYLDIDDFGGNKYLIGCGFIHNDSHIVLDNGDQFPIKKDTRAIHFEDMIDREGTEIFASLSEDGKGGDIGINPDYDDNRYVFIYSKSVYEFGIKLIQTDSIGCWEYSPLQEEDLNLFEVERIQE